MAADLAPCLTLLDDIAYEAGCALLGAPARGGGRLAVRYNTVCRHLARQIPATAAVCRHLPADAPPGRIRLAARDVAAFVGRLSKTSRLPCLNPC